MAYNVPAYAMFLRPTGAKIWEGGEPSPEPHTLCYTPRADHREARAQRGATERSEFKKYFSFNFILTGFLFNNYKFVFLFWILGRGVRGECPQSKTPYLISFHFLFNSKIINSFSDNFSPFNNLSDICDSSSFIVENRASIVCMNLTS